MKHCNQPDITILNSPPLTQSIGKGLFQNYSWDSKSETCGTQRLRVSMELYIFKLSFTPKNGNLRIFHSAHPTDKGDAPYVMHPR